MHAPKKLDGHKSKPEGKEDKGPQKIYQSDKGLGHDTRGEHALFRITSSR